MITFLAIVGGTFALVALMFLAGLVAGADSIVVDQRSERP
jgi:hypothetical protein